MTSLLILALLVLAVGCLPQMPWAAKMPQFGFDSPHARYIPSVVAAALCVVVILLVATGRL